MMRKPESESENMGQPRVNSDSPPQLPQYMPQLDSLRGLAISSVLLFHLSPQFFGNSPLGWIGVRVFFVLSGFLITGILLRGRELVDAGRENVGFMLRQFYVRRFLRILPIYYLVIFGLAIFGVDEVRKNLFWHAAYLSNVRFVIDGYFHGWVAHFWTLAVEEQFYLLWPAVIFFTPRKRLLLVIGLTIAAGPAYRLASQWFAFPAPACELLLPACIDTLGAGALVAVWLHNPGTLSWPRKFYAVAGWTGLIIYVAILVLQYTQRLEAATFVTADFTVAMFAAALTARAAHGFTGWVRLILEFKPLVYMGTISYGLYVYHEIVNGAVEQLKHSSIVPLTPLTATLLTLGGTFLVAALSWHCFEKPISTLKRYFPYDRPG